MLFVCFVVVSGSALYWTDWGDAPYIGKIGMDGSNHQVILTDNLGWPNALTIDYVTNNIYWGDARGDYMGVADAYGRNRRMLVVRNVHHIFALTLFENEVYWTDWETKMVHSANKNNGSNPRNVTLMVHRPMDLQILHPLRQPKCMHHFPNLIYLCRPATQYGFFIIPQTINQ